MQVKLFDNASNSPHFLALLVWMTRRWPSLLGLPCVVQPDTILRWHRAGFRAYWRWKSRGQPGRPRVSRELREMIRRMCKENPLWGAPRIHGEMLKLECEIAESTVSKYMIRHRGPPSQTWQTFLRNHADAIAAIDLCLVPTLTFQCLFAFLIVGHGRRQLLWFAVTRHPTAEWLAQQIVEAFPCDPQPAPSVERDDLLLAAILASRRDAPDAIDAAILADAPAGSNLDSFAVVAFHSFDPVAKRAEAEIERNGKHFNVAKGAPQVIVDLCAPDAQERATIAKTVDQDATKGYRTLGVARTDDAGNWRFLGLLPLFDPPRDDCAKRSRRPAPWASTSRW